MVGNMTVDRAASCCAYSLRDSPELLTPLLRIVQRVIARFLLKQSGLEGSGVPVAASR